MAGGCCLTSLGFTEHNPQTQPRSGESLTLLQNALHASNQHRLPEALSFFRAAAAAARNAGDGKNEAHALLGESACEIRLFLYEQALQSSDAALQVGLQLHDDAVRGAAANNRATIYSAVGDHEHAAAAAKEATDLLRNSPRRDYLARALTNYGDSLSELGRIPDSIKVYDRAMAVASAAGLSRFAAITEVHLGESLAEAHEFSRADKSLKHARLVCESLQDQQCTAAASFALAQLAWREQDLGEAQQEIDAVLSRKELTDFVPAYVLHHLRAKILLARGNRAEGTAELSQALRLAREWRKDVLPGDESSTRTVVWLDDVYSDYVNVTAANAVRLHSRRLAELAFDALTEHRAASLREQMIRTLSTTVALKLPPRYFQLLAELQMRQAHIILAQDGATKVDGNARLRDEIRTELAEIENRTQNGGQQDAFPSMVLEHPLKSIQSHLNRNQLLLSYAFGIPHSYLWAVTDISVHLYQLSDEGRIQNEAQGFATSLQREHLPQAGNALTTDLVGILPAALMRKREWLFVTDGAMLQNLPIADLPDPSAKGRLLIADHSIRTLPSALLLCARRPPEPSARFIGVGDAIYNAADPRAQRSSFLPVIHAAQTISLGRLVGSANEVAASARASTLDSAILTGADASLMRLRQVLHTPPRILHFAVHVVAPQQAGGAADAAIALSLGNDGYPQLLTKEGVATLRVPGTLVVMSGCASQQGEAMPGAGLIGLSRAWLLAGASAVVVSAWPTPDNSGFFFTKFYEHLHSEPSNQSLAAQAADALGRAQVEMQQDARYANQPAYWAGYSVVSRE